ncbi:MAG: hypothetical protein JWO38_5526 [Gemmataceae bacterium]|nr:hypothetical protein [Gemmataceae bacterium]
MATNAGAHIRSDGRTWAFAFFGAEIPLPAPAELKRRAIAAVNERTEAACERVAELLGACSFDYKAVPGKDAIEWLVGLVIHTGADHARWLADPADRTVHGFYAALQSACPDLGSDRVVVVEGESDASSP